MEVNFFFSKRGGLDVRNYSLLMRAMVSELKNYEKHRRFISTWIMSPKVSGWTFKIMKKAVETTSTLNEYGIKNLEVQFHLFLYVGNYEFHHFFK